MTVLIEGMRRSNGWDRWGALASTLCVVHCLATPIIAALLPAITAYEGVTHGVLAVAVLLFALLAFVPGARTHGKPDVLVLGLVGLTLIWTALLLPDDLFGDEYRDVLTLLGGSTMVAAHVYNVVLCRRCAICCSDRSPVTPQQCGLTRL